jgi:hypothetical protein
MRRTDLHRFRFDSFRALFWEFRQSAASGRSGEPSPADGLSADRAEEKPSSWEDLWIDLGGEG